MFSLRQRIVIVISALLVAAVGFAIVDRLSADRNAAQRAELISGCERGNSQRQGLYGTNVDLHRLAQSLGKQAIAGRSEHRIHFLIAASAPVAVHDGSVRQNCSQAFAR